LSGKTPREAESGLNLFTRAGGLLRELRGAARIASDLRSLVRLSLDVILFRLLRVADLPGKDRERTIALRDGVRITYRLNRGDIQSIREVWMQDAYRLPFELHPTVLIDLGANIGLTSVWLSRRYGCTRVVAVEPSPSNARLARTNLAANGIDAEVLEAAVGPRDGSAFLEEGSESNLNRLGAAGRSVRMLSMETVLSKLPPGTRADLVKMDIEGAEESVIDGDLTWLDRVTAIVLELHLSPSGCDALIARMERKGFRFLRLGEAFPESVTAFIRTEMTSPAQARHRAGE